MRLGRVSGWCARRAPLVIAAWAAAAVILAVWAPSLQKVGVQDETSFLPAGAEFHIAVDHVELLFHLGVKVRPGTKAGRGVELERGRTC